MRIFIILLTAILIFQTVGPAAAGSSRAGGPVLPAAEVATFANRVQLDLAARGVRVAIVARMGRDPAQLPQGVTFTHVAFWVYSSITQADGQIGTGYRVYNLYQRTGDGGHSDLVQDQPFDFFAAAYRLDAGIIIPDARLQDKLLKVIASPSYARLHNPVYAVLANPRTSQFQNCTEHTLDVVMASIYGTDNIAQIKANIAAYFEPQTILLDAVKRGLAGFAVPALTTADHGPVVKTATFGSLVRFMTANGLADTVYRITPDRVLAF